MCSYHLSFPWWRHQMETFSALLATCAGNSPVPVNSPHKGQWRGALMFSLICVWVNNGEAGDLRRYRAHYDVTVMHYDNYYHAIFHVLPSIFLSNEFTLKCVFYEKYFVPSFSIDVAFTLCIDNNKRHTAWCGVVWWCNCVPLLCSIHCCIP